MTRCLCVHTRTCFHTQASACTAWSYCEKCVLTARSPGRQTRLPAESSRRCCKGGAPCGGGGRHTVSLTPVDIRTAKPHARTPQQEGGDCVGGQQRRKSAKCPHNPRESKCGKYSDTSVKRKAATHPLRQGSRQRTACRATVRYWCTCIRA